MFNREIIDFSLRLYLSLLCVLLTLLLFLGLALFQVVYFFWYTASFWYIIANLCHLSLFFVDHALEEKGGKSGRKIGLRSTILWSLTYIFSSFLSACEGITQGRNLWSPGSDLLVNIVITIIGITLNFISLFGVAVMIGSIVVLLTKTKMGPNKTKPNSSFFN